MAVVEKYGSRDVCALACADGAPAGTALAPPLAPRMLLALAGLVTFALATAVLAASALTGSSALQKGSRGESGPPALEAIERARHAIVPAPQSVGSRPAAYVAENPGQRLSARFTAAAVTVGAGTGKRAWHSRLRLTGVGYGARLAHPAPASLSADGNRIELRRGQLSEWYVNGRRGIEQGFTLRTPPEDAAGGPLVLRMAIGGDLRAEGDGGGPVSLVDRSGQPVLSYGDLHAYDATGKRVPARMSANGDKLSLLVEDAGAAYPLTIDPLVSQAKLTGPPNDAAPGNRFARSVAVSGDTAVVGVPGADGIAATDTGAAYVFVRTGTAWSLQQKLTASDGAASDNFGASVALDGDTAVVGSPGDDDVVSGTDAGSAYVFVRSGTSWSLQNKLTQPDGATADLFGSSVRASGDTALVGAPGDDTSAGANAGSAHVFVRSGTSWSLQRRITRGAAGDAFGTSLGLSGNTALVGAPGDDTSSGADAGSAHVFVRSGTSWSFQRTFTAPAAAATDGFGRSADLSGDTVIVGAPSDDTAAGTNSGSADIFVRSGTTWSLQKQLTASDGAPSDQFGQAVAIEEGRALVGAPFDDTATGVDAGSAHSFVWSGTAWSRGQKLTAGVAADRFGRSVAQNLGTSLIGAPQDGSNTQGPGAAYVFVDSPILSPIQHVVLIYMENHSFDDVLGRWCVNTRRCDGTKQGKLPDGTTVPLKTADDLVPQVSHTTFAQNQAINGGRMDGFGLMYGCRAQENYRCLAQYAPTQIPNLISLANQYVVSDRTFQLSSVPSFGAHIEVVAASLAGFTGDTPYQGTDGTGPGWGCDSKHDVDFRRSDGTVVPMPSCIPYYGLDPVRFPYGGAYKPTEAQPTETIMDRLDQAGLTWKLYTGAGASYAWAICPYFAQCLYTGQKTGMVDNAQVIQDAANGTMPNFSVVLPRSEDSQHNNWSMRQGDNWIGSVMNAIQGGPDWDSTAVFIFYDDCGCFYDHVPPPPGFGIRTPMVIASPWVKPGYTDSVNASYASPLAFAEHNFGLAPLTNRDATAYDYSNVFDFSQQPLAPAKMTTTKLSQRELQRVRNAPKDKDDPT